MNHALRTSFVPSHAASLRFLGTVSLFHSSSVLERKRRSPSNHGSGSYSSKRCNIYAKRTRRMESRRSLLRDVSEYAEYLFQSWRDDDSTVWFRRPYWSKGTKLNGFSSHESQSGRSKNKQKDGFDFCKSDDDDDDAVENIFHSAFGREEFYYWASSRGGNFQWRCSSGHRSDWRYETDEETDEDTAVDTCPQPDLVSERLTLGLSASGPLKLKEIKSALFPKFEELGKVVIGFHVLNNSNRDGRLHHLLVDFWRCQVFLSETLENIELVLYNGIQIVIKAHQR